MTRNTSVKNEALEILKKIYFEFPTQKFRVSDLGIEKNASSIMNALRAREYITRVETDECPRQNIGIWKLSEKGKKYVEQRLL
jgi:hypothetical protein